MSPEPKKAQKNRKNIRTRSFAHYAFYCKGPLLYLRLWGIGGGPGAKKQNKRGLLPTLKFGREKNPFLALLFFFALEGIAGGRGRLAG